QFLRRGTIGRGERHLDRHRAIVGDVDLVDQPELVDIGGNFRIVDGLERGDDVVGKPRQLALRQRRGRGGFGAGRGRSVGGWACRRGELVRFVGHAKNPCALIKACASSSTSARVL